MKNCPPHWQCSKVNLQIPKVNLQISKVNLQTIPSQPANSKSQPANSQSMAQHVANTVWERRFSTRRSPFDTCRFAISW